MAFDGVLTPESASFAGGRLKFPGPWHAGTPRNASCTDFPLRDRRSRRLWGNRNGRLAQRFRGRNPVRANRPDSNYSVKPWSPSTVRGRRSEQNRPIACDCRHLQPRPGPSHRGLTEQLQAAQVSRVSILSPRPSGGIESCPCCGLEIASVSVSAVSRPGNTRRRRGPTGKGICPWPATDPQKGVSSGGYPIGTKQAEWSGQWSRIPEPCSTAAVEANVRSPLPSCCVRDPAAADHLQPPHARDLGAVPAGLSRGR